MALHATDPVAIIATDLSVAIATPFEAMAFAHMLKDYSVFPGLVMQFRSSLFQCCSLTGSCVSVIE